VGSIDQIASAISSLLSDANKRQQLARHAQRIAAEQFSLKRMVDEVERVYDAL
jgi:glycosyltransferase involved in cell wall biosynthesis